MGRGRPTSTGSLGRCRSGRPVAVLLPVDEEWAAEGAKRAAEAAEQGEDVAAELEQLRQEIDRSWKSDKTAVELVSEQRR